MPSASKLLGDLISAAGAISVTSGVANTAITGSIEATQVGTTVSQLFGMRNRIINGAMEISQRNAGASITPSSGFTYSLDRWQYGADVGSKVSIQQNVNSVTPPAGFSKYLGVTSLSAYTAGSNEQYDLIQHIEGFNTADLAWGTADAKTITLSFWVRSSLTGTFSGSLVNGAGNRSYPFTYTISSANTWEKETITIPGDTTGTWYTDNTAGVNVKFDFGSGSTFLGTANAWTASEKMGVTGSVSIVGTSGATWYITGVQFEVGSTATPFERRLYGQELALCRRYYQKLNAGSVAYSSYGSGYTFSSTGMTISSTLNPVMRTTPTATASGSNRIVTHGGSYAVTSFGGITGGTDTFYMTFQSAGTFTSALPGFVGPNNDTTASINLDSEL